MTVRHLLGGATLAAAATLLSASNVFAQTVSLPADNSTVVPPTVASSTLLSGYTLVTGGEYTSSVTPVVGGITGNLVSAVYRNNTDNTLAFFYQLTISGSTATSFNISSFGANTTSIAQSSDDPDGAGPLAAGTDSVSGVFRTTDGTTIQYNLSSALSGGAASYSQFVATNALTYSTSGVAGILGSAGSFSQAKGAVAAPLAPNVAPEPGSLALAATGMLSMLGMVSVRRRRAA